MPDIEEQIRRAYEEGKFDNLAGQGKPLKLDEYPLVDPEWRLAYHVLHSSGFSLPWIEKRREILEALETAQAELARTRNWKNNASLRTAAQTRDEWERAVNVFRRQIAAINKQIYHFNLEIPSPRFALTPVDADKFLIDPDGGAGPS